MSLTIPTVPTVPTVPIVLKVLRDLTDLIVLPVLMAPPVLYLRVLMAPSLSSRASSASLPRNLKI